MRPSHLTSLALLVLAAPLAMAEATPLTLADALAQARTRNPALQRQLLEEVRRQAETREAKGALLPALSAQAGEVRHSLNFEAVAGMHMPGFPTVVGPFSVRSMGVHAQVPLLDLSLWRRWKGAEAQAAGTQAETDRVKEEVSALVVGQYLLALRAEAQVRAVQARLELARALQDLAVHQEQAGVGTGLDTLRAKVRTQAEDQALIRARTARHEALSGLVRLMDLPAETDLQIAPLPVREAEAPRALPEDLKAARSARAEFRVLDAQGRAADERVEGTWSQHLPTIQAFGSLERMGLVKTTQERVFEVGLQVKVPLFSGGRTQAQVAQARAARSQVDSARRELDARVVFELRVARERLEAARNEVAVATETVRLAKAELDQARHRFEAGVSNNIELVSAQEELAKAEESHLDAQARLNQADADLAHARGELDRRYAKA